MASVSLVTQSEIVLTKIKKAMTINLGHTSLESLNIIVADFIGGKLVQASFDVLATKIAEDNYKAKFDWQFPSSWWQYLKQDKAPQWFVKRYPVKYTIYKQERLVKFTRMSEYPKANVAIPPTSKIFLEKLGGHETVRDAVDYYSEPFNPTSQERNE